jgi:preprotein translocase subunit SecF
VPSSRQARARLAAPGYDKPQGSRFARLYHGETNFDFINRWRYWFALSGAVIAIGLVALGARGLNFSIDFKGGTVWEVPTTASVATVRTELATVGTALNKATVVQLTSRTSGKKVIEVELPSSVTSNSHLVDQVTNKLASLAKVPVDQVTLNAVGPSWGSTITNKAIEAVVVFVVLIFLAIAAYFETKMAVGAIVALLHDMLVTVGIYALSGFQVSPDTVIAFLTVLGYSLYDTIVVFDKVKENTKGLASTNRVTYTDVVNLSMNQVLARSINTSFVAVVPVFCIVVIGSWIMGASALNDFGLALFIGLLSGAYSSIFIASPVLALLKEREPRYVEIRRRLAAYPQSRQVLTAANVAGGSLIAPRGAGGAPAPSSPSSPLSLQGREAPQLAGARALAGRRLALQGDDGEGSAGASYQTEDEDEATPDVMGGEGPPPSDRGAGEGTRGQTERGANGPSGDAVSRERASGAGATGGSAGAGPTDGAAATGPAGGAGASGAASRPSGGRPVPPRPRPKKKTPRRR